MGGKSSSSPPPPNYEPMAQIAREQLAFAKEQYAEMKPFITNLATTMSDAQRQQM